MIYKKHFIYILLCVNAIALSSCGIKPSDIEPPQGEEHEPFPKTYPNTMTDPKQGLERKEFL